MWDSPSDEHKRRSPGNFRKTVLLPATEKALTVLTPEQLAQWRKLTGEPFVGIVDLPAPGSAAFSQHLAFPQGKVASVAGASVECDFRQADCVWSRHSPDATVFQESHQSTEFSEGRYAQRLAGSKLTIRVGDRQSAGKATRIQA